MKQNVLSFERLEVPFTNFPICLRENPCEEDNLSTRDKCPVPNVSFVRRFYCIHECVYTV